MKYRLISSFSIFLLASFSMLLSASEHNQSAKFQQMAEVLESVEDYVRHETRGLQGEVIISGSKMDDRITLPKCLELEPFIPAGGRLWGNTSIGVRCHSPKTWTIYVRINIQVMADVVHVARPLTRDQPLTAEDITLQRVNLTQVPDGIFTDPFQVIGKIPVTNLPSGQLLRENSLRLPYVILSGQKVTLHIKGRGFSVSSEGNALANAAEGQVVQVRNQSGRIISGIARHDGIVDVRP
ncbi:MAG: flagellar basal body P-ring formation chaperone FlgA [Nitrosomonas sp.]|nr:flagellar basal body P-ring formation chaperone FlgA [Nitrosomonas sp.]